jgi:hypothetical protein
MQPKTETLSQAGSEELRGFSADGDKAGPDMPSEPALIRRERDLLRELIELIAECVALEPQIDANFHERNDKAERKFDYVYQSAIIRFATEKDSLEREIQEARRSVTSRYESEMRQAEREYAVNRRRLIEQYEDEKEAAKSEYQESRWTTTAVHDGSKGGAENLLKESQEEIAELGRRCRSIREEADEFLQECRLRSDFPTEPSTADATMADFDPFFLARKEIDLAETKLKELKSLKIPRYFRGEKLLWIILAAWVISIGPFGLAASWLYGLVGSAVAALAVGGGLVIWLYSVAKAQAKEVGQPLYLAVARAEGLLPSCQEEAAAQYHRQLGEGTQKYKKELRQLTRDARKRRDELKQRRAEDIHRLSDSYRAQRAACKEQRTRDWGSATEKYRQERGSGQRNFDRLSHQVHETLERELSESKANYDGACELLSNRWCEGRSRVQTEVDSINDECSRICSEWTDPSWNDWQPPHDIPPALRFGEFHVRMAEILEGVPSSSRLKSAAKGEYRLPALLPFPTFCSMLIKAQDEGRNQAAQVFQNVMLRLLAVLPPGKLRFTIVDPVGLGRNFASFMHLADYDDALVTSRIWTETTHIDQKLTDLTEHMETVIQKYLRDQFPTIEDYNVHAQEVAEPYRFLVVANFPVNFSPDAVRRLVSIIQSGPRCGVYTLISADTSQPLPVGFSYSDLEQAGAVLLNWQGDQFKWQDDDFTEFPLRLDAPPPADFSARLLRQIGEKAKEAKRVEVPFEFVVPQPAKWWTGSSRGGIDVPLGRVGATKRQHLRLGHGTSQHVLIAGKTGSGKSTFLHALICNLAVCYSPEEVELYLVDFKKGVEFKTYANHELRHARVIAIESEREFGLSVLQRLDAELKRRAELFRAVGAQELAAYRQANGSPSMPRILLVVDEFQEFFVEDDKIAQDASLLLDRLVRQGRAFGLHVLLGSQTLGGAYTLARSTIDQMAVRIALQCSETDAHLILSHDNSAARLLSRPGEAIYNDANGLVEGNNPFQIVWLSDDRRESYLEKIQEMAARLPPTSGEPQIVFEGNAPADARRNAHLIDLFNRPRTQADAASASAWLGEAIAIKEPTSVVFTPQSGNNLLIVGQNDAASLGMLSTALIGLSLQLAPPPAESPTTAQFYVLDGTPEDAPHAGFWNKLADALGPRLRVGSRRELPSIVADLAAETSRRAQSGGPEPVPLFLFIYGLHRFRDLRRNEDDFGFSSQPQEKPSPANQLAEILRDGAAAGVHALVWCDSLNNLTRTADRQSLREFELRVLFQMSAADSSTLIDSPLASKLGVHRALFCSEEQGKIEKFRPYGLPPEEWIDRLQKTARREDTGEGGQNIE